jgi:hypothetical protein
VNGKTLTAGTQNGGSKTTFNNLDTNGYGMKVRSGAGIDSIGIYFAK